MPAVSPLDLGLPDSTFGFYLPVRATLTAGSQKLIAFYRVRYYAGDFAKVLLNLPAAPPKNQNPKVTGLYRVSSPDDDAGTNVPIGENDVLEVSAGDKVYLRAYSDEPEKYDVYDGDLTKPSELKPRTITEIVPLTWYATGGSLGSEATGNAKPDKTLKLDKHVPASGSTFDLWVVAQDDRGGTGVLHRTLKMK
jgi:hypothetical protein